MKSSTSITLDKTSGPGGGGAPAGAPKTRKDLDGLVYALVESPLGWLLAVGTADALVELRLPNPDPEVQRHIVATYYPSAREDATRFNQLADELGRYFRGEQVTFTETLAPVGTPFQQAVWRQLCAIPHGTTVTYRQVGIDIGRPTASRAVGGAVGSNPIGIVIPCHRVIASDGTLHGFGGGLPMKKALLQIEGVPSTI